MMGKSAWLIAGVSFAVGLLIAAAGTWMVLHLPAPGPAAPPPAMPAPVMPAPVLPAPAPAAPVPAAPAPAAATPEATPPEAVIQTAAIAAIDGSRGDATAVYRPDVDADILVIDFPDLREQALTLNRVAALIEKAGMPRDKVLSEAELNARIAAEGIEASRFYIGHDYRVADLARFFALADEQHMALNPHELWLRHMLQRLGWLTPGAVGAVITLPGVADDIDAAARSAVLRHELSHAVYFTDPAYVRLTIHFWKDMLSADERAAFRRFLASEGYDASDEDLMANEGQAYLIHTTDPRFFRPAAVGMSDARAAALRSAFIAEIPEAWLKQGVPNPPPAAPAQPAGVVPAASKHRQVRMHRAQSSHPMARGAAHQARSRPA